MAEDTSTRDEGEQAPAALESKAEPKGAVAPSAEAPEVSPGIDEVSPPDIDEIDPDPASQQGIDPQLIVLCLVLWVVAAGIVFSRWSSLKVDWYLGNVKTVLGPLPKPGTKTLPPRLDEDSIRALVDMADDTDVVEALRKELNNRSQIDQRYRAVMIEIAKRIGDEKALAFIAERGAIDYDYRVRANSYLALAAHGPTASPELRERALQVLQRAVQQEAEQAARSVAAGGLGEFKDSRVAWDLIKTLRDAEGDYRENVRGASLSALYKISGKDEAALPFDVKLEGELYDAQIQAWEEWFKDSVGAIPAGESLREVRDAEAAASEGKEGDAAGPDAAPDEDQDADAEKPE